MLSLNLYKVIACVIQQKDPHYFSLHTVSARGSPVNYHQ